jgi:hypothetical protein
MKFIEDIVDVIFDGRNFNVQVNRDLLVCQALVDQSHNFRFTFCETNSIDDLTVFDLTSERGYSVEGQTRHSWRAQGLSIHDGSDVADEIVKRCVYQEIPGRSFAFDTGKNIFFPIRNSHDDGLHSQRGYIYPFAWIGGLLPSAQTKVDDEKIRPAGNNGFPGLSVQSGCAMYDRDRLGLSQGMPQTVSIKPISMNDGNADIVTRHHR